ncbi:hypothetical protein NQ317_018599, partial [Molorchus minor]
LPVVLCYSQDPKDYTGRPRRACNENVNLAQPARRVNTLERVKNLTDIMKDDVSSSIPGGIHAYIITSTDEHQSIEIEDHEKRRQFISGFSGAYGDAVVTIYNKSALWTDSRYHLQADEELGCEWLLFREGRRNIPTISEWLKQELPENSRIGVYSKVISEYRWNKLRQELDGTSFKLVAFENCLIDQIWTNRPPRRNRQAFLLKQEFAVILIHMPGLRGGLKGLEPRAPPFAKRALDVGAYAGKGPTGACFKISSKTIIPSKSADKCTYEAAAATSSVFSLSLSIKVIWSKNQNNNAEGTPVLTLICIERDVLEELEFDDVIQEFVKLKLRKKYFDLRKDYVTKTIEVREKINKTGAESMVITSLDEIAWLLNIRGRDIPFSQFLRSYVIIDMHSIRLFVDRSQLDENTAKYINATKNDSKYSVNVTNYSEIWKVLSGWTHKILVPSHCVYSEGASHAIYSAIKPNRIVPKRSPIISLKAVKNEAERKNMREVNIRDAAAICDCFAYVERIMQVGGKQPITETTVSTHISDFRYEQYNSYGTSFRTKVAFGYNSAYPSYELTDATNAEIFDNSTLVVDSGGQYYGGTTVLTRTIHFGKPTNEMIEAYTRVLIGLIQLSSLKFPNSMKMAVADSLARASLWEIGLDYEQETAYGVGAFLATYESPVQVRFDSETSMQQVFKPGYFLLSAPAYYSKGEFGVRLGNMLEVTHSAYHSFLEFETITFVPFESKLINLNMLSTQHRRWLNNYNQNIRLSVGSELKKQKRMEGFYWMMEKTKYIPEGSNISKGQPVLVILLSSAVLIYRIFF